MKNHDFQKLADQCLSGLEWDERRREQTLRAISKEEKPVKKVYRTFVLVAAILCLSVSALAAGVVFSNQFDAVKLAEKALEQTYGITLSMQSSFFTRTADKQPDGSTIITFSGIDYMHYVLGDYTVIVHDGKASTSWSHDGEDTAGLFEADAWGAEQLSEMLRLAAEESSVSAFAAQAKAIAQKHGAWEQNIAVTPPPEAMLLSQQDARAARNAAGRTEEDLLMLALDGAAHAYELTAAQRELLLTPYEIADLDSNDWTYYMYYHTEDGETIFTVMLSLHQQRSEDGAAFIEKDGVYWVDVNVETGVIENILYDSQLGGNG